MSKFQFTVYDLTGKPKSRYEVKERSLTTQVSKATQKHHIIIVDRSGSMSYSMPELKESVKKTLALHEYHDDSMLVSLLSYSSMGDLTTHFVAKPVSKIDPSEIDKLRATYSTCISQSLVAVKSIINKNHVTGITLHSDGFANDPSSFTEKKSIFDACEQLAKENVFINTIAHSDYADFQLLSGVANKVSGRCVRATGIKQLYDSIIQTFEALKTGNLAVSHIDMEGADYLVYLSPGDKKVIGSSTNFDLSGIDKTKPGSLYSFTKISLNNASSSPIDQNHPALFAFARAMLAEGNVNMAKYILASTGNVDVFNKHWKASTVPALANMAGEFESLAFGETKSVALLNGPVKVDDSLTVLKVLQTIEQHKDGITLDVESFLKGYDRRGVKRIPGSRDDNGVLTEPSLELEMIGEKGRASISSLDISTTSANVSINTTQKCRLVKKADKTPILKVAGIAVDSLPSFRSYTIVGDGELTVETIPVYISDKKAFEALAALGVLYLGSQKASKFDFAVKYEIVLKDLPITKVSVDTKNLQDVIRDLFVAKILSSMIGATLKEESDKYTPEQVAELEKNYLSKNLYINFPTTNEYSDLEQAIKDGKVDVRSSFKIKFGTDGILGFSSFKSANEFFKRGYDYFGSSSEADCTSLMDQHLWAEKKMSAKVKITSADALQKKVFDYILGLNKKDEAGVAKVLKDAGITHMYDLLGFSNKENLVKALSDAQRALDKYIQNVYMENIFPVVFFIGSFGMAPDEWNASAMTADTLKQQWPDAKIGKAEADGMFFKTGEVVFGVNSERRYVSIVR